MAVATRKAKKNRERRLSSARETAEKGSTFDRTSLNVPEGAEFFKPNKEKVYRLDIIPYEVGKGNPNADEGVLHYERTFYVHRGVGPNNESYVCPRKNSGKKCPVCEHRAKLLKDPDTDEELVKSLAPKKRQLFNVIDHEHRDEGVKIWDESYYLFGKFLDKKIKEADEDDQEKFDNFHDPENGLMLRVGVSEESGAGFTYYSGSNIEFKERKEQYDEDIVDKAFDLDKMVKEIKYDDFKKIFLQDDGEEDDDEDDEDTETEDEDEDEEEKPVKKGKGKKKPSKDEDEDDEEWEDDEEEEDDDEDEEEPKKKGKKAPPKKKKKDEDEDEEEPEDEEDEELPDLEVEDTVDFVYKGKKHRGVITKIINGLCHIKCPDRSYVMNPDECTVVENEDDDEPEDEEDEKPAKKGKKPIKKEKKKAKDEEEEEDEEEPEDEEDEDEEEDDDEPKPKKKRK